MKTFAMKFSLAFALLVFISLSGTLQIFAAETLAQNTLLGTVTLEGHYTWTDAQDIDNYLNYQSVSESYSVESNRLSFLDDSGNAITLSQGKSYRITLNLTRTLNTDSGYASLTDCNYRLYMVYGGEKYYFTTQTLQCFVNGAGSSYFTLGVEFDVSALPYYDSSTKKYGANCIKPTVNITKINQGILLYGDSVEESVLAALNQSNQLQSSGNALQQESNDMQQGVLDDAESAFTGDQAAVENAVSEYDEAESALIDDSLTSLENYEFDTLFEDGTEFGFLDTFQWLGSWLERLYLMTEFSPIFGMTASLLIASILVGLRRLWR